MYVGVTKLQNLGDRYAGKYTGSHETRFIFKIKIVLIKEKNQMKGFK